VEKFNPKHFDQCTNKHYSILECNCTLIAKVIDSISFTQWFDIGVKNEWIPNTPWEN
jgi:hypothetical protein